MKKLEKIITEFRQALEKIYGDKLINLVLYGSQARGDATEDSDIDIMVVLRSPVSPGDEIFRMGEVKNQINLKVELKSKKGINYTKLRDLLAAGKWKEADLETGKVMCQAAGRENEGWLRLDDIDNFPCEDLRTINQLWLHYSKGKFGFSVQKEIYESLGGTREYNGEVWEKFGDRVGWRKGGIWLSYSDLTFNLNAAPKAHLPLKLRFWKGFLKRSGSLVLNFVGYQWEWVQVGRDIGSLLSRKEL